MSAPPYLTVEGRVDYLYDYDYFDPGTITDEHANRLAQLNFHYFLGYARNYRALVGRQQVYVFEKNPDDVFKIIDKDLQVATLLHEGLRLAEWQLRASVTEHYCAKFSPAGSYLVPGQYRPSAEGDGDRIVAGIMSNIYRHDEPYVRKVLAAEARENGVTKPLKYEPAIHETCIQLAQGLPLWSVIDSFNLGLLGKFIMNCDITDDPLWKMVAQDLDISANVFETQLKSLNFLRNCVAHHARLWLRPTVDSPREPRLFKRRARQTHPKSMYWAILNLATFQPEAQRQDFADRVDGLIHSLDLYEHGITHVHEDA